MKEPVSDHIRLLAMIEAASDLSRTLTTSEVEAMCYILSEHERKTGLFFNYDFKFGARPRSGQCYGELVALQHAGYVGSGLVEITSEGRQYLERFGKSSPELMLVRRKSKEILPTYIKGDLVIEAMQLAEA